ncbi:MAG: class I SAM-dependent methyltransferase [Desulfobacterales bacterium]
MNYGLHYSSFNDNDKHFSRITDADEKYPLQLYQYLIEDILHSKIHINSVLEVGCGRGGGSAYLAQKLNKAKVFGIDISSKAIWYCRKKYSENNLSFSEGDAESIAYPNNSFDLVINVESSHCYPSFNKFLSEAKRVLTPGGTLLLADFRSKHQINSFKSDLISSGLQIDKLEDITELVLLSLKNDSKRKENIIEKAKIPAFFKSSLKQFAGCIGSGIYNDFQNRKRIYYYLKLKNDNFVTHQKQTVT